MKFKELGINTKDHKIFTKKCDCGGCANLVIEHGNLSDRDLAIDIKAVMNEEINEDVIIYVKRMDNKLYDLIIVDDKGYYSIEKDKVIERLNEMIKESNNVVLVGYVELESEDRTILSILE